MEPKNFVELALEDFPDGENTKHFVARTVGVVRWGFAEIERHEAIVDKTAFAVLDLVEAWANGKADLSEVENLKKPVILALISARGAWIPTRSSHLECEKDALNIMEWFIGACMELAASIAKTGSYEPGKVLGKLYGVVWYDIPQLISAVDTSAPTDYYVNESVKRFFAQ